MFSELEPAISFKCEGFHIDGVLIIYQYFHLSQLFLNEQIAIINSNYTISFF
jgi:hypothetical protein